MKLIKLKPLIHQGSASIETTSKTTPRNTDQPSNLKPKLVKILAEKLIRPASDPHSDEIKTCHSLQEQQIRTAHNSDRTHTSKPEINSTYPFGISFNPSKNKTKSDSTSDQH